MSQPVIDFLEAIKIEIGQHDVVIAGEPLIEFVFQCSPVCDAGEHIVMGGPFQLQRRAMTTDGYGCLSSHPTG